MGVANRTLKSSRMRTSYFTSKVKCPRSPELGTHKVSM
jgi:hypothetical protein